jgi:hypothetical protein
MKYVIFTVKATFEMQYDETGKRVGRRLDYVRVPKSTVWGDGTDLLRQVTLADRMQSDCNDLERVYVFEVIGHKLIPVYAGCAVLKPSFVPEHLYWNRPPEESTAAKTGRFDSKKRNRSNSPKTGTVTGRLPRGEDVLNDYPTEGVSA